MVYCAHCGNALQSDRHRGETPLYRERHAHECPSNNTSSVAEALDQQMATIIKSLTLPPDIEEAVALFSDTQTLWAEATPEERRQLINPLVENVYVDLGRKQIAALTPAPALQALLRVGFGAETNAAVPLEPSREADQDNVGVGGDGGESNSA